ncbi:MAG: hypothetical protein WC998_05100 [Candidatus Paceibacterota bacterium]|jgi:hypothetical protein
MDYTKIKSRNKLEQYQDCIEMAILAEKITGHKCDGCSGLGQTGFNVKENYYVPCQCVTKAAEKARKEMHKQPLPHEILPEENN